MKKYFSVIIIVIISISSIAQNSSSIPQVSMPQASLPKLNLPKATLPKPVNVLKKSPLQNIEVTSKTSKNDSISKAISVAERFLGFVERKNVKSAEMMSYKKKRKSIFGREKYYYKVSKYDIQFEIDKYKNYGNFISRELVSQSISETMPSMPDSQYVILRYKLKFTKKAEEYITIVIKTDGEQSGKVVAYPFAFIYAKK